MYSVDCITVSCFRNYTGPQKAAGEGKGSSRVTYSKASKVYNEAIEVDEDSHSKYVSDTKRFQAYERDIEDSEVLVFFVFSIHPYYILLFSG